MNETNYNSDMGSNADDEHQMPPNSIIHFPTADSSDHDNNPLTSHCSESSDLMSDTDDTASKRGSDGHIPINIECGHPIQTRAPGHRFKLGVQAPGPLRLNWLAIHLVACCPSLNRMAAPGVDWDVTIQARFAGSDECDLGLAKTIPAPLTPQVQGSILSSHSKGMNLKEIHTCLYKEMGIEVHACAVQQYLKKLNINLLPVDLSAGWFTIDQIYNAINDICKPFSHTTNSISNSFKPCCFIHFGFKCFKIQVYQRHTFTEQNFKGFPRGTRFEQKKYITASEASSDGRI
ncbi:hypothetical protein PSTT_14700 [Puccinia striiformis]|uniref:Uncharacterized protein n=1 Tax=Puccinia striiformis TaxID=27350 RepID=A0A2S4UL34_9BASI|nr:hypothetical protein PSTT_14700 [Puccinia striiformis]